MKNKRTLLIISSIIIIIIAIIGIVFALNNKKETVPEGASTVLLPELQEEKKEEEVLEVVLPLSERKASLKEAQGTNEKAYWWMSIPGTNINTPIIYDISNDNAYWENRNIKDEVIENTATEFEETVSYLSYKTVFDGESPSSNIVVFGHNWNNINTPYIIGNKPENTMFAQLPSFTDLDFAKKYQYIYTNTEDKEQVWQIFSVMHTEAHWPEDIGVNYIETDPDKLNFEKMLEEIKDRSEFDYDISVNHEDKILTLSTCTRYYSNAGSTQRLAVVARLLRSDEKPDTPCEVAVNQDKKQPAF